MAKGGISMKVEIVHNKLPTLEKAIKGRTGQVIEKGLTDIEATAKASMSGSGGGRTYRGHTASAPGQPPAIDTGQLVGSLGHRMTVETEGIVYAGVEHAGYLEKGTRKMAPRPFLEPAAKKHLPQIQAALRRVIEAGS